MDDPVRVSGIYLLAPQGGRTPDSFTLEALTPDGTVSASVDVLGKVPAAYRCGRRVFMMGYFPLRDVRFATPVETAHLRVRIDPLSRGGEWSVSEVGVFRALSQNAPRPALPTGVAWSPMLAALHSMDADRVYADPWVSAQLHAQDPSAMLLRRYNPESDPRSADRTVRCGDGRQAFVVDDVFEEELRFLLRRECGEELDALTMQGDYVLLKPQAGVRGPGREALIWMARTALRP